MFMGTVWAEVGSLSLQLRFGLKSPSHKGGTHLTPLPKRRHSAAPAPGSRGASGPPTSACQPTPAARSRTAKLSRLKEAQRSEGRCGARLGRVSVGRVPQVACQTSVFDRPEALVPKLPMPPARQIIQLARTETAPVVGAMNVHLRVYPLAGTTAAIARMLRGQEGSIDAQVNGTLSEFERFCSQAVDVQLPLNVFELVKFNARDVSDPSIRRSVG